MIHCMVQELDLSKYTITLKSCINASFFSLVLVEFEYGPPEHGNYICIDIKGGSRSFTGSTRAWASQVDFELFLRQVGDLITYTSELATIHLGVGDDTLLLLNIFPYDHQGHFGVFANISTTPTGREKSSHETTLEFEVDLSSLDRFAKECKAKILDGPMLSKD